MSKAMQRTLEAKLAVLEANREEDSSDDEEDESDDDEHKNAEKAPSSSRKSTLRSSKKDTAKGEGSNVIYIGHLPRGFEEHELRQLLKQFGKVIKLKLVRSKKTGNSRGYAFCQFPTAEIAAIVAETFSGYIVMGQHRLVCHVIASERVHRGLFQKLPVLLTMKERRELFRKEANENRTVSKMSQITAGLLQREQKKRNKLKALGIDYFDSFPGFEASAKFVADTSNMSVADSSAKNTKDDNSPNNSTVDKKVNKRSSARSPSVSSDKNRKNDNKQTKSEKNSNKKISEKKTKEDQVDKKLGDSSGSTKDSKPQCNPLSPSTKMVKSSATDKKEPGAEKKRKDSISTIEAAPVNADTSTPAKRRKESITSGEAPSTNEQVKSDQKPLKESRKPKTEQRSRTLSGTKKGKIAASKKRRQSA